MSWGLLSDSMTSWEWPASLANLQAQLSALLLELGRGEGSLWSQLVKEAPNPELHPEVEWDAEVRIGDELCFREKAFLRERKRKMLHSYAKLFGVSPSELDERDLPIVAIAGKLSRPRCPIVRPDILQQAVGDFVPCATRLAPFVEPKVLVSWT